MNLLLITIAVAVGSAWIMFKIYNFGQAMVLKKMDWNLEELKSYEVTPTVKNWNRIIETIVILAIFYKVFFL